MRLPWQRYYYWALGYTAAGKRAFLGPFDDEEDAALRSEKLRDVEIFKLTTPNSAKAAREVKAILLKREEEPDSALSRLVRNRGFNREVAEDEEPLENML